MRKLRTAIILFTVTAVISLFAGMGTAGAAYANWFNGTPSWPGIYQECYDISSTASGYWRQGYGEQFAWYGAGTCNPNPQPNPRPAYWLGVEGYLIKTGSGAVCGWNNTANPTTASSLQITVHWNGTVGNWGGTCPDGGVYYASMRPRQYWGDWSAFAYGGWLNSENTTFNGSV